MVPAAEFGAAAAEEFVAAMALHKSPFYAISTGETMIPLYEALQDAYNGALEISHKRGRAFIELTKTFCSRESVTTEARTLSDRITRHLGICATVQ